MEFQPPDQKRESYRGRRLGRVAFHGERKRGIRIIGGSGFANVDVCQDGRASALAVGRAWNFGSRHAKCRGRRSFESVC